MSAKSLNNKWVSLFINGLIALVFGSIFIFIPQSFYLTIIIGLGALLVLMGIGFIFFSNRHGKEVSPQSRMVMVVQGLFNIGIGVFMMLQPELLFKFVMTFMGIWLIVAGSIQLYDSHSMRNVMNNYKLLLFWGFANITLGVVIILWPEFPIVVFGYISYFIALIMFIYAGIFYKYRNYSSTIDVEAEVVSETTIEADTKPKEDS